jgi:peptidoglycan/LPS O-acetylase OafA/YrhL
MHQHNSSAQERIIGLDAIRTLAILAVVFSHTLYFLGPATTPKGAGRLLGKLIDWVQPLGALGVELFFVLSGFLIGTILIKTYVTSDFSVKEVRRFLQRRWFRTLPSYWLILTMNIVLYQIMGFSKIEPSKALFYPFFQNVWQPHPPYFFGEAWSLSVEEWSYLILPISLWGITKLVAPKNKKVFLIQFLVLFAFTFILFRTLNAAQPINGEDIDAGIRKVVLFRLDALVYGIIMAYVHFFKRDRLHQLRYPLLALSMVGTVLLYYCIYQNGLDLNHCSAYPKKFYVDAFLYLLLPLNFSLLLPFANSVRSIPSKFWSGLIRYISKISYSMYLIHYSLLFIPFFSFISVQNNYQVWALYILYWTLLLGASSLLYRYFELPIMNLRDRMK